VALAAHTDEVGFRIRRIEQDGFLRFEKVGGTDNRVLLGQRVWVGQDEGRMLGVLGTKSAHLLSDTDRTSVPQHTEMYIDIGARSADEARDMGVEIGTPAGYVGELRELGRGSGRYTAHALDDRVGCAVLLAVLESVRADPPPVTVVACFTVQEEVGLRGAQAVTQGLRFDLGIAVDTTATDDTPDIGSGTRSHLAIGAGPGIKVLDMSLLAHPAVLRGLRAAARNAGIEVQDEILMRIGTDAGALQFGGSGVPAGTLSVGTRYTHSPIEVLDGRDLNDAVSLVRAFLPVAATMDLHFLGE
jgi:endoglucanase